MKKLAIAGASVALAAMPIMGVFADDITSVTDDINVTVDPSCTFNGETAKAGVTPTTYGKSYTDPHVAVGQQADFNGATEGKGGEHAFTVFCNDNGGWRVEASAPGALQGSDATHNFVYTNSEITAPTAEGQWSAAVTGTAASSTISGYIPSAGGVIAGQAAETPTAGSTFTVTYAAWAGTQTAADTYSGQVVYTLSHPQTQQNNG